MTSGMYDKIPSGIRKSIDSMISRGYNGEVALAVILSAHRPDTAMIKLIVQYMGARATVRMN